MAPPTRRFHVDCGPTELFQRIQFIIGRQGAQNLDMSHAHASERNAKWSFPVEIVTPFRSEEWDVLTAEVLPSGKFMRSTWSRVHEGRRWLVTFAKGNVVVTAYPKMSPARYLVPIFSAVESSSRRWPA